jgi:hypothetical protein
MTEQPTKTCRKCGETKPLLAYAGRQNTCVACTQAQRAKTQERKDAVAWSPELGERIVDCLAAGMTIAELTAPSWAPTARQLRAFRRSDPSFDAACDEALAQSAAAHLDKAKAVLQQLEAGKLPSSDAKTLFDGHMKLAATLDPRRYGNNATIDLTSAGKPVLDFDSVVAALLAAVPVTKALTKPDEAIDVQAEAVPPADGRTLQ